MDNSNKQSCVELIICTSNQSYRFVNPDFHDLNILGILSRCSFCGSRINSIKFVFPEDYDPNHQTLFHSRLD